MKKLILLVLFVCIGSINAQEKIIVDIEDQKGFDRIHKYYKNALGDKYEVIKNKPVEMTDIEDVVFWNEVRIRDNYELIGKINEMNFDYFYNIISIKSSQEHKRYLDDSLKELIYKKTFLSTINFGRKIVTKMREIRTKDGSDDLKDLYYNYVLPYCCSKQTKIYNYEDKLVDFSDEMWDALDNNNIKKVMLYGSGAALYGGGRDYDIFRLNAIINYDGGAKYFDELEDRRKIKKNGITSYYTLIGKPRDNPSISQILQFYN
jgi:hypothetical protein